MSKITKIFQVKLKSWIIFLSLFFSLYHWFIIKGTAKLRRCIGQGVGKRHTASMPTVGSSLSPNLQVFTKLEALKAGFYSLVLGSHQGVLCWGIILSDLHLEGLLWLPCAAWTGWGKSGPGMRQ